MTIAPPLDEATGVVASPARIDAWIAMARAGDRFVYATRCQLPVASQGAKRMRDLSAQGLVYLTRTRGGGELWNYIAERSSKPTALTRPDRARLSIPPGPLCEAEARAIDALLPVLARAAQFGRPCPTNAQLGARSSLSAETVALVLEAMVAAKLIVIQSAPRPTLRRILILASGAITGLAA